MYAQSRQSNPGHPHPVAAAGPRPAPQPGHASHTRSRAGVTPCGTPSPPQPGPARTSPGQMNVAAICHIHPRWAALIACRPGGEPVTGAFSGVFATTATGWVRRFRRDDPRAAVRVRRDKSGLTGSRDNSAEAPTHGAVNERCAAVRATRKAAALNSRNGRRRRLLLSPGSPVYHSQSHAQRRLPRANARTA